MEKAIKKAIEGGWRPKGCEEDDSFKFWQELFLRGKVSYHIMAEQFLDPLFWQALGKAEGWSKYISKNGKMLPDTWLFHWHRFIDHLAEGKSADSFFEELLK